MHIGTDAAAAAGGGDGMSRMKGMVPQESVAVDVNCRWMEPGTAAATCPRLQHRRERRCSLPSRIHQRRTWIARERHCGAAADPLVDGRHCGTAGYRLEQRQRRCCCSCRSSLRYQMQNADAWRSCSLHCPCPDLMTLCQSLRSDTSDHRHRLSLVEQRDAVDVAAGTSRTAIATGRVRRRRVDHSL